MKVRISQSDAVTLERLLRACNNVVDSTNEGRLELDDISLWWSQDSDNITIDAQEMVGEK